MICASPSCSAVIARCRVECLVECLPERRIRRVWCPRGPVEEDAVDLTDLAELEVDSILRVAFREGIGCLWPFGLGGVEGEVEAALGIEVGVDAWAAASKVERLERRMLTVLFIVVVVPGGITIISKDTASFIAAVCQRGVVVRRKRQETLSLERGADDVLAAAWLARIYKDAVPLADVDVHAALRCDGLDFHAVDLDDSEVVVVDTKPVREVGRVVNQPETGGRAVFDGGIVIFSAGAGGCVGLGRMGRDGQGKSVGFEVAGELILSVEKKIVCQGLDASLIGIPGGIGREIM